MTWYDCWSTLPPKESGNSTRIAFGSYEKQMIDNEELTKFVSLITSRKHPRSKHVLDALYVSNYGDVARCSSSILIEELIISDLCDSASKDGQFLQRKLVC